MAQVTVDDVEARSASAFGWGRLALIAAIAACVGHLVIGAVYRDLDAFLVAISLGVACGLTRVGRGTVGSVALGLASANVAFWTVPATLANVGGRVGFWSIVVPGTMAVMAVTVLVAVVGQLAARRHGAVGEAAAMRVAVVAAVGLIAILGVGAVGGGGASGPEPGDIELITDRSVFSDSAIVVPAGTVGVYLENRDYFWHTFTITELGVDLRVPVGASGRITFEATPGSYEFVCAIPGHDIAGMVGTLTVLGE